MKLKYQYCKGGRIKNRKWIGVDCRAQGWWWMEGGVNVWKHSDDIDTNNHKGYSSSMWGCKSVKAFRRRLKEWAKYMPKGTTFVLISRYVGYSVYGKI